MIWLISYGSYHMGHIKGKSFIFTYVGCDTCGKSFVDFGTNSGDSGFSKN